MSEIWHRAVLLKSVPVEIPGVTLTGNASMTEDTYGALCGAPYDPWITRILDRDVGITCGACLAEMRERDV
jgi:hypothetical protein